MKISFPSSDLNKPCQSGLPVADCQSAVRPETFNLQPSTSNRCAAFTMMEIAISLAVIGIALVAIIGILPYGMNTQRQNREQTVINQDATMLLEAIRSGSRGLDDLTNYVFAITNYWGEYNTNGAVINSGVDGYTFQGSQVTKYATSPFLPLTNGFNIIGLLSTPEFTDLAFRPVNNLLSGGFSNHVVAYVHSMSGPAIEKPPQDNSILRDDSFSYKLFCVNAPVAPDTNSLNTPYNKQIADNLHELRMTFLWPLHPNSKVGGGRWTYRTLVAGYVSQTNVFVHPLYFYQSQSFTNAP